MFKKVEKKVFVLNHNFFSACLTKRRQFNDWTLNKNMEAVIVSL